MKGQNAKVFTERFGRGTALRHGVRWEAVLAEVGTEPATSRKALAVAAGTLDKEVVVVVVVVVVHGCGATWEAAVLAQQQSRQGTS